MKDAPVGHIAAEVSAASAVPAPGSVPAGPGPYSAPGAGGSLLARILIAPIRGYQMFISPALPPTCRYVPTCSQYAVEALRVHGALKGSWLALRRIGRCHPWHWSGYDPVPPRGVRRTGAERRELAYLMAAAVLGERDDAPIGSPADTDLASRADRVAQTAGSSAA